MPVETSVSHATRERESFCQHAVENRVRDLVSHLVGVTHRDRFGGEQVVAVCGHAENPWQRSGTQGGCEGQTFDRSAEPLALNSRRIERLIHLSGYADRIRRESVGRRLRVNGQSLGRRSPGSDARAGRKHRPQIHGLACGFRLPASCGLKPDSWRTLFRAPFVSEMPAEIHDLEIRPTMIATIERGAA